MIELTDCIRAVSYAIESEFGEAPISKDIHEGFNRPCTYVQTTEISAEKSGVIRNDFYTLEIIRFATKDYAGYVELLTYQKKLAELLSEPIPVADGFFIYPENIGFELAIEDYAIVVYFDIDNYQEIEDAGDVENMERLYESGNILVEND